MAEQCKKGAKWGITIKSEAKQQKSIKKGAKCNHLKSK